MGQLLAFAEKTADFVGISDPWGRVQYLNQAAQKRLGVADVTGLTLADIFPPEAFGFYYDVVRPQLLRTGEWSGEVLVNAAGADAFPMYVSTIANLGPGGETNGGVMYAHELSHRDPPEDASGSEIDADTGLLCPAAFDNRVRRALTTAHRDRETCALVLAEITGTEEAIERCDTLTATTVMRVLAGRITRLARTFDTAGRVSERQLGLLLRDVRNHAEVSRIARILHGSLTDPPVTTPGGPVVVSVRCGVALSEMGDSPGAMIERATESLNGDTAFEAFDAPTIPVTLGSSGASVTMHDFQVAMSHGHVVPYAQSVVDLGTGNVIGFRGFARWHRRALETLEAATFVDVIAESPLANQLDLYVARETAAALLLTAADTSLRLYAPVSRRLIADVRTEQYLCEIADAFFLPMHQIHLQLAWSLFNDWTPALRDALQSLRDADITLTITGIEDVSSIGAFPDLAVQELHISRRLVQAAAADPASARTVADIIHIAHDRGLIVAATGVHHRDHRDAMINAGCDLATGDLYGKPKPTRDIEDPHEPAA